MAVWHRKWAVIAHEKRVYQLKMVKCKNNIKVYMSGMIRSRSLMININLRLAGNLSVISPWPFKLYSRGWLVGGPVTSLYQWQRPRHIVDQHSASRSPIREEHFTHGQERPELHGYMIFFKPSARHMIQQIWLFWVPPKDRSSAPRMLVRWCFPMLGVAMKYGQSGDVTRTTSNSWRTWHIIFVNHDKSWSICY